MLKIYLEKKERKNNSSSPERGRRVWLLIKRRDRSFSEAEGKDGGW